ncbi:MAG: sulfocyanin-like copper-binding protein [Caldilineaceae bacterium]
MTRFPEGRRATRSWWATPYVTTSYNHVFAIDAATGDVKWHFAPDAIGKFHNFGLVINRGLAYCNNKVFMLTLTSASWPSTQRPANWPSPWTSAAAVPDARAEYGYYETQAPVCYKGIAAHRQLGRRQRHSAALSWRTMPTTWLPAWPNPYWTVPPEGQDWRSQGRFHGGGAVWMSPTIDTTSDTVYFSVGNPSPDFFPELRPGNNPVTNAVIAVDLHSGQEKWRQQQLAGDQWDYDTGQSPMVYTADVGGETRRVVSVGNKEGRWFVYDAKTGDPIYENVQVPNLIDHPPLKKGEPVVIAPSATGGINYAPQAFDPGTNYALVAALESKAILVQEESAQAVDAQRARGDVDTGAVNGFGNTPAGWHDYGSITALDLASGKIAWKVNTPEPERGGLTTTATGLAFAGGGDGNLRAFDTATGAILWQFQTGAPIAAGPTVYTVDGTEYVAVTVGGTSTSSGGGKESHVMAFALGGDPMQAGGPGYKQEGVTPQEALQQAQQGGGKQTASQFISLGSENKTVVLDLIATYDGTNSGLNYNGYAKGEATYSVPEGWTVKVNFKNLSNQQPHSVQVATTDAVQQSRLGDPVFAGAGMPDAEAGITSGSVSFTFTADKQGEYTLACAVPGHAEQGMWLKFNVTAPDSQPSLQLDGNSPYTPSSGSQ